MNHLGTRTKSKAQYLTDIIFLLEGEIQIMRRQKKQLLDSSPYIGDDNTDGRKYKDGR